MIVTESYLEVYIFGLAGPAEEVEIFTTSITRTSAATTTIFYIAKVLGCLPRQWTLNSSGLFERCGFPALYSHLTSRCEAMSTKLPPRSPANKQVKAFVS